MFAITGQDGIQHGYEDGWKDGVFHYFGEGQSGDMAFTKGNKAIRDHVQNNKELLLFEKVKRDGSLRYRGAFFCAGYEIKQAPDPANENHMREAIVFQLMPLHEDQSEEPDTALVAKESDLSVLRKEAYESSGGAVEVAAGNAKQKAFKRSAAVRDYAVYRSDGLCELCRNPAPFQTNKGKPYLEVHHIFRLTDGGPDHPRSVAALCPNCHRAAHHAGDKSTIKEDLAMRIAEIEDDLEGPGSGNAA
ncbi:MAG: HNH endonuclease [Pseudomonadota bacterium]